MTMNTLPYLKYEAMTIGGERHTHTIANVSLAKESCFRGSLMASPHS